MPRKISEFFQPLSKLAVCQKRKIEDFSIDTLKSSNVGDPQDQMTLKQPQIIKNIKMEPEKEFITVLGPSLVNIESKVLHAAKKIKIEDVEGVKTVKIEEMERNWPPKSGKIAKNSTKPKTSTIIDKGGKSLQSSGLIKSTNIPKAPQISKNSPSTKPNPQSLSTSPSQPRIIKCKFCPHQSSNYNAHSTHVKHFHEDKLHTCDLCFSKCSTLIGIKLHMINMHLNKKFHPFICDYCGKELKSKARIYYHVLSHRPRIECQICHIKIKHESMQEHLRDFHVDERKFNCKMCTKTFKADKDLKRHEKVHLKKFNCQICFRKFRLQYDLNVHAHQTHENPGSFKCEICGMKFNEKVVLKRHTYKHNNKEKNLKCDRCDYASADKQLYKRHLDAHKRKDERESKLKNPMKCKICFNLYKNQATLVTHMKYSHSGDTFQCDICSKIFKSKRSFLSHLEKHKV